jgi:hypothetical protein
MNNISREPKYDNDYITKGYLDKQLSDSKDTISNQIDNLPKSYSAPPNPPYYKDSLLSYNNKLYRCIRDKLMGVFSLNDWVVIATDDKTVIDFIDKTYSVDKIQLEKQIDDKVESWYQSEDPANDWTTDILKAKHVGDYWYDTITSNQYRFCKKNTNPVTYAWSKVDVPMSIYNQINSKKSIYTSKPTSYKKDDLWIIEDTISDDDLPPGETENPVAKGDWVFATQDSDVYNKNHWIKRDTDVSIEYIENHYYTKEKVDETFSTKSDVQSKITKAKDEIELSVKQNYSTKKEITEIVNDYDEKIGTINTTIDNQGELISDLSVENGRISSSVSSINTKITTIESDVDTLNDVVDTKASSETVEDVINSVNNVQTSVSQNITAIKALKVNDEVQSQKISDFEISVNGITSTVQSQNDKISKITQTTDEINSKISDIADITTSGESQQASVNLVKVNESEPIYIKIHPISEDISYLYPSNYLYPADDLYLMNRIIRFTNTDTNEVFDYELPDDLLYYDANNYDEFILNYDSQTCSVIKRVEYNKDTNKNVLKTSEETINYDFPIIALTAGNYTISLPGYSSAYLYVQLMASNIYTTQFATKVEMSSEFSQTKESINLELKKKVDDKDYTSAQILLKINNDTSSTVIKSDKLDVNAIAKFTNDRLKDAGSTIINGSNITTGTISAARLDSKVITTDNFSAQKINADNITSGTISSSRLSSDVITTTNFSAQTINADKITAGTISADRIDNLGAEKITSGTMSANRISGGSLNIGNNTYYLRMQASGNNYTKNPSCSGLTIGNQGLVCNSTAFFKANTNFNGYLNIFNKNLIRIYLGDDTSSSCYTAVEGKKTLTAGGHSMTFYNGLLVAFS